MKQWDGGERELDKFDISIRCKEISEFSYVRLSVTEGKYRMIRRILHNAGHSVLLLHRTRYGGIRMNDIVEDKDEIAKRGITALWPPRANIPLGAIRSCTKEELDWGSRYL